MQYPAGERFIRWYEFRLESSSRIRPLVNILYILLAILFFIVGVILWVLPGSGWLMIFIGLFLLAGQSKKLALFMDRLELRIRHLISQFTRKQESN